MTRELYRFSQASQKDIRIVPKINISYKQHSCPPKNNKYPTQNFIYAYSALILTFKNNLDSKSDFIQTSLEILL